MYGLSVQSVRMMRVSGKNNWYRLFPRKEPVCFVEIVSEMIGSKEAVHKWPKTFLMV